MSQDRSTIAALATAPEPAAIAIVRVSGPQTRTALRAVFKSRRSPIDEPRSLIFGELIDYKTGDVIDHALTVFMPSPNSFTGEDVGEFQFHGSPLLVQKVLRSLFAFGIIPAEPGEFTKRAFLNGKMDLVQAEAIAELINASSENALRISGEHLKGKLSTALDELGEPLRNLLAEVEATLDFPEEDIETKKNDYFKEIIQRTIQKIGGFLSNYNYGFIVREGFRVLLCGYPNVGKSSLLNSLLGRDRAIVSPSSGTTRDLIEERANFGGYSFVLCDSAGIRETNDSVEKIGVELARERISWADLVLLVVDATDQSDAWKNIISELRGKAKKIWMVTNKIDLNSNAIATYFCDSTVCTQNFYLSTKTGDGIQGLIDALVDEVKTSLVERSDSSNIITNERQRNCLSRADQALKQALSILSSNQPLELLSAEIREALTFLDEIVGKTYTEDILGRIFSRFCIGK